MQQLVNIKQSHLLGNILLFVDFMFRLMCIGGEEVVAREILPGSLRYGLFIYSSRN